MIKVSTTTYPRQDDIFLNCGSCQHSFIINKNDERICPNCKAGSKNNFGNKRNSGFTLCRKELFLREDGSLRN